MNIKHLMGAVAFSGLMATSAVAENLSVDDLDFALGVGTTPELMSKQEMVETKGEGWQVSIDAALNPNWVKYGAFYRTDGLVRPQPTLNGSAMEYRRSVHERTKLRFPYYLVDAPQ